MTSAALASEPPPVVPPHLPPPRPALERQAPERPPAPLVTKTEPAAPLALPQPAPAPPAAAAPPPAPDLWEESFPTVRPLRRRAAPEPAGDAAPLPGQLPSGAHRATLAKLETPVSLFVVERSLEQVLGEVARAVGFRIRVNDRIDEVTVVQRRLSGTAREVLEELTRSANLVWFVERDLIDVAKADTSAVKTFQVGRTTDVMIRDAMQRFGLVNADFAVEVDEANGIVRVFAPPRLMSRVESILAGLRPPAPPNQGVEIIRFGQSERAGGKP